MKLIGIITLCCLVGTARVCGYWICSESCNNNVMVAVCICEIDNADACMWTNSYCMWEHCYGKTHVVADQSKCDNDKRPNTVVSNDKGQVPPYTDNGHN